MSLLEQAKSAFYTPRIDVSDGYGVQSFASNYGLSSFTSSVVRQMIDCYTEDSLLKNPRENLLVWRLILERLSFIAAAASRKRMLVGCPMVESKDKAFADEANAFLAEVPFCGELNFEFGDGVGIDGLLDLLISSVYSDGTVFRSFLDSQGRVIERPSAKMEKVRIHDSARLTLQSINPDEFQLWYMRAGVLTQMRKSRGFGAMALRRSSRYAWGLPLVYECEAMLSQWLTATGNRQMAHYRLGNPPSMTFFGYELPKDFDPEQATAATRAGQAAARAMQEEYKAALANSHRTFSPVDVVGIAPGSANVHQTMFGAGAPAITQYVEEMQLLVALASVCLNYPVALLLPGMAKGGLGSNEFDHHADVANSDAKKTRSIVGTEFVRPLIDVKFTAESRRIPKYELEWEGMSIQDQLKRAEAGEIKARAIKTEIEAYVLARQEMGPENADMVAEEMGKEWDSGFEPAPDPQPMG